MLRRVPPDLPSSRLRQASPEAIKLNSVENELQDIKGVAGREKGTKKRWGGKWRICFFMFNGLVACRTALDPGLYHLW
ncbi:hypothetical protein A2533_04360 [Candidatus Falkowbacteria bacterium RIFOXYD2_FULL_35_9]|uniref:Uncharacterized protein n=1 Tax=Candidatus Falkowbacteria bacterium RIFOXYC2_FULL_36_12 TaxID=1798002 RepID=A0A1F5T479_9BACT|nr:MAG: hypothetical protein A2300_03840 [Candidatus Falkowbacteria bacterium RIFOXYB2_FULL_35_7]OGF33523.1 MAG: hypothetical protein A2478_02465 [Candidatus Falkowbacteria bacterium RIFOXYC2_FULL_36_12]OGF45701.1 MAG: hypothetical protein A2533_04360 [Candidatus Falkowbacteria bacterium RIFOXYD2_FULL_35_9]